MSECRELRVRVPIYMIDALELLARRQLSNVSICTRQALQARLIKEGLLPADAEQTSQHRKSAAA